MVQSREKTHDEDELSPGGRNSALTLSKTPEEDFQTYRIADLNVAVRGGGRILSEAATSYRIESTCESVDIEIDTAPRMSSLDISGLADFDIETLKGHMARTIFWTAIIEYGGIVIHASAVVLDGKAYLFSASSGTGKSTHTSLWRDYFGTERTYILNDDRPVIRRIENQFFAYGSPWSGKDDLNRNSRAPLQAIVFIEQSPNDQITMLDRRDAIYHLLRNTYSNGDVYFTNQLLDNLTELIKNIPTYSMGCTEGYSAVELAYNTISNRMGIMI